MILLVFKQDPKHCLDMCEEIMQRYGAEVLFRQFNALYIHNSPIAPCSLLDMEGFINIFKYMNSVCAAVFDLEDMYKTVDYNDFINAVVTEIRNRIAV